MMWSRVWECVKKEEGSRVLDGFEFEDFETNHSEC